MLPVYFNREQRIWVAAFIVTLTLTGNAESSDFDVSTRNVTATVGEPAKLICSFTGESDVMIMSVLWKKGTKDVHNFIIANPDINHESVDILNQTGHFEYNNTNGRGTTSVTIKKTEKSDEGQYLCSIDIFGESGKTKELYLTVEFPPTTPTPAKPRTLAKRPEKPKKREQERDPKDKNRPSSLSLAEKGPSGSACLTKATVTLAVVSSFLSLCTL